MADAAPERRVLFGDHAAAANGNEGADLLDGGGGGGAMPEIAALQTVRQLAPSAEPPESFISLNPSSSSMSG